MSYTPFLIADTRIGLERDIEPWLLPQNGAYPQLEDCYMFRGRVKKKQGYQLLARLQRQIGTTNGSGNLTVTIPGFTMASPIPSGISQFIVGTTTYQDGTITSGGDPVTLLVNGIGSATLDRGSGGNPGQLIITGGPINTAVLYESGLPVMGLPNLLGTTINQFLLMGFDTRFSYLFNTSTKVFNDASFYRGSSGSSVFTWSGTDSQFFWTTNYAGALWATNSVPGFQSSPTSTTASSGDGIRWFDQDQSGWVNFLPQVDSSNYLQGCLMIFPYKGRLVVLNTTEGPNFGTQNSYNQRARWSENGSPFYTTPTPTFWNGGSVANAWRSDLVGFGGYVDAVTLEKIVSAQFIKDTLVVFFEHSTWNLRYTGNDLLPFVWEKINTELGATSTFSEVAFDRAVLGIGDVGVHACDTVNVIRIDEKIPDEVFGIQNKNQGRSRVYGVRDFFNQLVYWTMPWVGSDQQYGLDDEDAELPPPGVNLTYPNKILVYNYVDKSYSFFNDSFTCFGYYQKAADTLWQDVTTEWQSTGFNWVAPQSQQGFPFIVAGNQLGFVEIFDPSAVLNGNSLFITNITPGNPLTTIIVPNHNLTVGTFVKITSSTGITGLTGNTYKVLGVSDANTFTIGTTTAPTGVFTGPGAIAIPSNINIISKRFNNFIAEGSQVRLGYIDFYFDATENGQVTILIYNDEDSTIPINTIYNTINTYPETTYQLDDDTTPFVNTKLWKRLYVQDIGQLFQVQITMNDTQMMTDNVVESDVVLHGMILWFSKSGRLINV